MYCAIQGFDQFRLSSEPRQQDGKILVHWGQSPGWQKLHGSTDGTRQKVWTRTKISLFGGRALPLPSLRSPVEEAQAGLLLLREEVASLRSIFLSMKGQGHLASLMPASAGTCASRGSASHFGFFHQQSNSNINIKRQSTQTKTFGG